MPSLSSSPTVTVLMPVYNAAEYLPAAIESVRTQTFTDWELVLVDDGSTDASGEICQAAAAKDPRIRILSQANAGVSAALNSGLKIALGQLIARLDADDLATPQRLERQVNYMQANPSCVVVGGQALQIDCAGRPLGPIHLPLNNTEINAQLLAGRGSAIVHSGCMLRAEAMQAVGGYRNEYNITEDLDLFLRLSKLGTLANLPDQVVIVRRHLESVSALRRPSDNYPVKLKIVSSARQRRGEPFDPHSVRKLSPPASQAEAYTNWMLTALRAGHWKTAGAYAWLTLRSGILRPWLWPAIFKRGVYAVMPGSLRRRWDEARTRAAVRAWETRDEGRGA